ncbi:MAG TPA: hypothetical protein VKO18_08825 [Terriglobia bacterium]|nr:hypothetical protein [Terriglobia bacterium]
MADTLLYQGIDRIDFHPLRAPAEGAVGRRVAPANNVDPKGFFDERLEQVGVNVEQVARSWTRSALLRGPKHHNYPHVY